jgi:tetratricopeptide (TPR) repeat protein
MSKKLPNYQEKQHILYVKRHPDKDLIAYGNAFLEEGKISDAIDFYQKANYVQGLEKIKGMAELSGDAMLIQQVLKPLKQSVSDEAWNAIGERALELKKYLFALHAFEKSNNITMVGRIKEIIKVEEDSKH